MPANKAERYRHNCPKCGSAYIRCNHLSIEIQDYLNNLPPNKLIALKLKNKLRGWEHLLNEDINHSIY